MRLGMCMYAPAVRAPHAQRVARNGRCAESLSGEEPALGAALSAAYVAGVQARPRARELPADCGIGWRPAAHELAVSSL